MERLKPNLYTQYFNKSHSQILAGIAVLMMIWGHLFGGSQWYSLGVSVKSRFDFLNYPLLTFIPSFTDLCVQIFAIISGYALYINNRVYSFRKKRLLKLCKFLISYWIILIFFLIIGKINNDNLPTFYQLFHNLWGLKTHPMASWINIPFGWYVAFYIQFILMIPFLLWIFKKNNVIYDIIGLSLLCVIVYILPKFPIQCILKDFFGLIHPIFCVGLGFTAAKYNIFYYFHKIFLLKIPTIGIILLIFINFFIKYKLLQLHPGGGYNWSFFLTFCFSILAFIIVSLYIELISRLKSHFITFILSKLGVLSMYLWFLHGIFFTGKNFMQKEIFSVQEPLIIFFLCMTVLIPISILLRKLCNLIYKKLKLI